MPKRSAGLLLYHRRERGLEVFLVHPGGPFFAKKDLGAWSIPKGEHGEGEPPLVAALREFAEETGRAVTGTCIELGQVRQAGGKIVTVFALEGDFDPAGLVSNTCQIEWPPRSGRRLEIPEVDRGAWFALDQARAHILLSQQPALDMLVEKLGGC